jgi:hypothetical protein
MQRERGIAGLGERRREQLPRACLVECRLLCDPRQQQQDVLVGKHVNCHDRGAALDRADAVLRERRKVQVALAAEPIEVLRNASAMIDHVFHGRESTPEQISPEPVRR